MLLFRLLSFAFRVVGSFFFVFLLQIQFDGKTLESYLNNFGKKFIVTKSLQKVSQDGVKIIRSFSSAPPKPPKGEKSESRQISSSQAAQYAKDFASRFTKPDSKEKKNFSE